MGVKKLETIKISMEKGKAKVEVNGEDISSYGSYLNLTFENGEWSLMTTRDSFYCSGDRKPLIIGKTNDKTRYCPKCFQNCRKMQIIVQNVGNVCENSLSMNKVILAKSRKL